MTEPLSKELKMKLLASVIDKCTDGVIIASWMDNEVRLPVKVWIGDDDINVVNMAEFLTDNPDYLTVIFRALGSIFINAQITEQDNKIKVLSVFNEQLVYIKKVINESTGV